MKSKLKGRAFVIALLLFSPVLLTIDVLMHVFSERGIDWEGEWDSTKKMVTEYWAEGLY